MASLVEARLAERLGRGRFRPLVPELFWVLADAWPRDRVAVPASLEELEKLDELDERAGLRSSPNFAEPDAGGWALSGERGANAWGAPLVLTADYPVPFYVPDAETIRIAVLTGPRRVARVEQRTEVCLAVDPTGLATSHRYRPEGQRLPLAHPLFCALDLAAAARGRESLERWDPPEAFERVW